MPKPEIQNPGKPLINQPQPNRATTQLYNQATKPKQETQGRWRHGVISKTTQAKKNKINKQKTPKSDANFVAEAEQHKGDLKCCTFFYSSWMVSPTYWSRGSP